MLCRTSRRALGLGLQRRHNLRRQCFRSSCCIQRRKCQGNIVSSGGNKFTGGGVDIGNYNSGYTDRYLGGTGHGVFTLLTAAGVFQSGKSLISLELTKALSELRTMNPIPTFRPLLGDENDDF